MACTYLLLHSHYWCFLGAQNNFWSFWHSFVVTLVWIHRRWNCWLGIQNLSVCRVPFFISKFHSSFPNNEQQHGAGHFRRPVAPNRSNKKEKQGKSLRRIQSLFCMLIFKREQRNVLELILAKDEDMEAPVCCLPCRRLSSSSRQHEPLGMTSMWDF